jgi:hypothetical protein
VGTTFLEKLEKGLIWVKPILNIFILLAHDIYRFIYVNLYGIYFISNNLTIRKLISKKTLIA